MNNEILVVVKFNGNAFLPYRLLAAFQQDIVQKDLRSHMMTGGYILHHIILQYVVYFIVACHILYFWDANLGELHNLHLPNIGNEVHILLNFSLLVNASKFLSVTLRRHNSKILL